MSEYTYPGVYIKEVPSGPGPIAGVSTSTAAFVGFTLRGKVDEPILCTSFPEVVSKTGNFTEKGLTAHEAYAFYQNEGQRCYVVRVVPTDAVAAYWDFNRDLTVAENITNVAQPSGLYTLQLDHAPVVAGSVATLKFDDATAANVNVFKDDGAGNLVFDPTQSGVSAAGGSGTIDYTTGEISVTLTNPTQFAGGAKYVSCLYDYTIFRFRMVWPGAAGNYFRVTIQPGSDDFLVAAEARWTRFTVLVDEDVNADPTNPSWSTVETFADLVFDNPSDPNYVATVINDTYAGSQHVEVVDYGNAEVPPTLQGSAVVAESFAATQQKADGSSVTVPDPYDGLEKAWQYAAASAPFPRTFTAKFQFIERALRIGTGDGTATPPIQSLGSAGVPAKLSPGAGAFATAKVKIHFTKGSDSGAGLVGDDGAGNLIDATSNVCGTVNYTTGALTLDLTLYSGAGDTAKLAEPITVDAEYASKVAVADDGNGVLALAATQETGWPQKFGLNANGTNTLDYETGIFIITWQITGSPGAGPAGDVVAYPGAGVPSEAADYYANPADYVRGTLANGSDGSVLTSADVVGAGLVAEQRGLYALGKSDEMMQVVISDFQTDATVDGSLLTYCESRKDKFAILTVPNGMTPQEAQTWKKYVLNRYSSYGALYYPHVKVLDPLTNVATDIPCGGHVAGVYARTDANRNVGKAPAGVGDGNVAWSVGLERTLTQAEVGVLYPDKINCLVEWPFTGRVVWGARTLDIAGGEWPYVQQRRLFMFLEKSIFQSTHIHVFQNNGPQLWSTIRAQVVSFLASLFQQGYFAGETANEAFFVTCDRTNNPQTTVDKGLVFCDVGVAANKPGEFLVFRFQQKVLQAAA